MCAVLLLSKGKPRLGAFDEPLKIAVMFVNHQQSDAQGSSVDDDRRRMTRGPQKIDEQRHGRGRRDGAQRNKTPIGYAKKEEQQGDDGGKRA